MNRPEQTKAIVEHEHADGAILENDFWVWGVIFSAAALTALCVAMVFCLGAG